MFNYDRAKELYVQGKSLRAIAQELNIDRKKLSKKLKEDGLIIRDPNKNSISKSKRVYSLNESVFSNIDSEEKAYWLGFLYADGYINRDRNSIELSLAECDLEHLEKFKSFTECENEIKYRPNQKAYRLVIYSQKIVDDLIKLGCTQAKSLTLQFPTESQVPSHLIQHFMRGYFDGDGSVSSIKANKGNSYQLRFSILGTSDFLNDYESILLNVLNREKGNKRQSEGQAFSVSYNGNKQAKNFFNFLYNNATIYLERKYAKFTAVLGASRKDS